ncbi:MAG TPA: heme NO-binding domain-containing protein [Candidatus Sulfobium mesophilum]|nr:heme NO-binding domain-containing protein [Candidatus Sulfobium mesophilum]
MKGVIAMRLKDLVVNKFGADKWAECLKNIGEAQDTPILATSDMHDEVVVKMFQTACKRSASLCSRLPTHSANTGCAIFHRKFMEPFIENTGMRKNSSSRWTECMWI